MKIDVGDTVWVMVSAGLVMLMTPGLALFYGGMVRAKNVLGMLMQNMFCLGMVSVLWAVGVYSLAFHGTGRIIGDLDLAWLHDATKVMPTGFHLSIPPYAFLAFQMMFAVITPALITGAIADRMRWSAWVWFLAIWVVVVYAPIAHWVFSPAGWLFRQGALDFAGGTVVHVNAGIAALAAVLVLGKRRGWPRHPMPPHNLPLTLIGAGILWFGWFGFNAGSALAGDSIAAVALVNTHMAAAAAMLSWLAVERIKTEHATTLGAASGLVAGLVAITPCAGFVGGMSPIYIGLVAGALCALAVELKFRLGFDDSLDVVGVHLVGGIVGSLLLGLFATHSVNPAVVHQGLFVDGGGLELLGDQVIAVVSTLAWSFVATLVILLVLQRLLPGGIRVSEEDEDVGLDLSQHSETGYALDRS
ncbi:MAG TPA: ammonium transporter [Acidimicrobiia bacterium]|nr:ammonium transporter [Acidimicrobiia bacterium]